MKFILLFLAMTVSASLEQRVAALEEAVELQTGILQTLADKNQQLSADIAHFKEWVDDDVEVKEYEDVLV
jgi:hypothetical protein